MLSGRVTLIEDKTTDPLFMKEGSAYYFYHTDNLGTPQKMTAVNGAVVWSAKYSSFGKATVDAASTITNPFRFPGQYEDTETGLHYNYHRYYDPKTGRYLNADPIGVIGGINYFSYVLNNPINRIDQFGLLTSIELKEIWETNPSMKDPWSPNEYPEDPLSPNIRPKDPWHPVEYPASYDLCPEDCKTTGWECFKNCTSTLGVTEYSIVADIAIEGVTRALKKRLFKVILKRVGAVTTAWDVGVSIGCAFSCSQDRCHGQVII